MGPMIQAWACSGKEGFRDRAPRTRKLPAMATRFFLLESRILYLASFILHLSV